MLPFAALIVRALSLPSCGTGGAPLLSCLHLIVRSSVLQFAAKDVFLSCLISNRRSSLARRGNSNHGPTDYESTIVALKLYMQSLARQNAAE